MYIYVCVIQCVCYIGVDKMFCSVLPTDKQYIYI